MTYRIIVKYKGREYQKIFGNFYYYNPEKDEMEKVTTKGLYKILDYRWRMQLNDKRLETRIEED